MREMGYDVSTQEYLVGGGSVKNIECSIIGKSYPAEIIIVGAHYDSVMGSPGANDNASGVAAVIEIARYFRGKEPLRTIRFVFFVNEEPPYFHTEMMGSRVYALRSRKNNENIVAMYSLETIGYYSDSPGSQKYPFVFRPFYPTTGNFIGFIGNLFSRKLLHRSIELFRENVKFPSEGVAAPGWIIGIDWSDHSSFWKEGYPALMITDTAPFRYRHYHSSEDTFDKIDYYHMARVVAGLSILMEKMSNRE
jgi:Zn-dependent M28 family amino/carboxypeptidase